MSSETELPDDIELSRDAGKLVSATSFVIDCRYCWNRFDGNYREAHLAYEWHLPACNSAGYDSQESPGLPSQSGDTP